MTMEIKLSKLVLIALSLLTSITSCKGQEYTKKQLDSLYSNRYQLYDSISPSDVKLNGLFAINEHKKILENIETMFGKADAYEEYGPFPDEGIENIGHDFTYGCTDFDDCKKKQENNIFYNLISFSQFNDENSKTLTYISIKQNRYKNKNFFIKLKHKNITIGNNIDDIKKLFPNSYKYYKLLLAKGYSVGFQVMIFSENKKIYFGLDENNIVTNLEIDEIE